MIDMEQVRRRAIQALEEGLPAQLTAIDASKATGLATPAPAVYLDYPILDESMVTWPVCLVLPRRTARTDSGSQGVAHRRYELDMEFWFAESDQAVLGTWVERMAGAASAVLEQDASWSGTGLYNQRVTDALYSDVLPDESGFLRACRVVFAIDGIDATEG